MRVLGGDQGLRVHEQAIADLDLGGLGLRRPAAAAALLGECDCFHTIVERMIAPEVRLAAPPTLPSAFIVDDGRLSVGCTSKPAGFYALDVRCDVFSLFGLGGAVGDSCLMSQLAGVYDKKTEFFYRESPVGVFHFHWAGDTAPVPASWGLLPCPARLVAQSWQRRLLLAPPLPLLAHPPAARAERDEPQLLLQTHAERALTVGLTVGHAAAHPRAPEGQALRKGHGGLGAGSGLTSAHAQAGREAITAHATTPEPLLAILRPRFAVPLSRPRRDWPVAPGGLLRRSAIAGDRRRLLVPPGGREGLDRQGRQRDRTKHTGQMRRKQPLEALPQPVRMAGGARQARLEYGAHPTFLQTCPHLVEGMMAIEKRSEQGFDATATREPSRGVRRADGSEERRHVELAYHAQHQRPVGHRPALMHGNGHAAPRLPGFLEGPSSRVSP